MILDSEFYDTRSNLEKINELIKQLRKKIKLRVFILITTRSQEKLIMSRYSYIFPLFRTNIIQLMITLKKSKFKFLFF